MSRIQGVYVSRSKRLSRTKLLLIVIAGVLFVGAMALNIMHAEHQVEIVCADEPE